MPEFVNIEELEQVRLFVAAYDGTCDECGADIQAGETMGRTSDGEYVCEDCAYIIDEGL